MPRALLSLLLCFSALAHAAGEVIVAYRDKPPYSYTEGGQPRGFLIERTMEIFRMAGVPAAYVEMPPKRITYDVQTGGEVVCSPSWYKLPEREAFARFTLAIHQDKPHAVVAAAQSLSASRKHKTLKSLLADPKLRLGVIDGVSYGPELDKLVNELTPPPARFTIVPLQLLKMVAGNRDLDVMFIDDEDLSYLDRNGEISALGVERLSLTDVPPGLKRYIMCSKHIDPAVVERLDGAIRKLMPKLN